MFSLSAYTLNENKTQFILQIKSSSLEKSFIQNDGIKTYITKFSSTRISHCDEGQKIFSPLFSVKIFVIRYSFQQN